MRVLQINWHWLVSRWPKYIRPCHHLSWLAFPAAVFDIHSSFLLLSYAIKIETGIEVALLWVWVLASKSPLDWKRPARVTSDEPLTERIQAFFGWLESRFLPTSCERWRKRLLTLQHWLTLIGRLALSDAAGNENCIALAWSSTNWLISTLYHFEKFRHVLAVSVGPASDHKPKMFMVISRVATFDHFAFNVCMIQVQSIRHQTVRNGLPYPSNSFSHPKEKSTSSEWVALRWSGWAAFFEEINCRL